ncbi:MAG: hypothetical protein ACRDRL_26035 [Sciscionella sp.]
MTQVATGTTPPDAAALPITRTPFSRLLHVELRKLMDTRAGKWLLVAIGAVTVAAVIIFLFAGSPANLTYAHFVNATGTPEGLLLPVLAILAVTSEWSQRTGLVTFTLEPNRQRVIAAKLAAVVLLGVAAIVFALGMAALANLLGEAIRSGAGSWAFGLSDLRDVAIEQFMGMIQGFGFGMLFMNSAASIVLYYILPTVSSIVFNLVTWLRDHLAMWVDLGTTAAPLRDHTMAGNDWAHLAVAVVIWIAIPFAIGLTRVLRGELKSS